ncbi:hypothetical protein ACUHMQ_14710 [Chitinimonas sp. PSY-7]|uniref:hypothetical protein n=1 Tax=Chitinimonas sp. PSY-7 TaxID=3459088 RepID=UPI0040402532
MKSAIRLPGWFSSLRLLGEIWLLRQGKVALTGWVLLLAAAIGWLMALQAERHEVDLAARSARTKTDPAIASSQTQSAAHGDTARLAALYQVLTPAKTRNHALTELFAIAADEGWDIAEADYSVNQQRNAGLERLQIVLPLVGNYPDIRDLAEAMLRGKPNLSLDDISFKRENAEADILKATLKISIWSRLEDTPPQPEQQEARR